MGELMDAFCVGDTNKIQFLTRHLPEEAKGSILTIILDCIKDQEPFLMSSSVSALPLLSAIKHNNYHLCKMLLEEDAPIERISLYQPTPLILALQQNRSEIAELLIDYGANVFATDDGSTLPLYWAIHNKHPPSLVEKLLSSYEFECIADELSADPVRESDDLKAIHCAATVNNIEAAKILIKYKADVNTVNLHCETAVSIAVRLNFPDMVRFLVSNGADLNNKRAAICPLCLAIRMEHLKMVELLIELGVDIKSGWVSTEVVPPLQYAISYLNVDIIRILLDKGADVNDINVSSKETALHVAAFHMALKYSGDTLRSLQTKVSKLLIDRGANINAKDYEGRTPLDFAIHSENTELCKLFLREGADVTQLRHINDGFFSNRFVYIARFDAFKSPELMDLCLERGCDYNYRDKHGLTPYHYVMAKNNPEMVKVFWKHGCPFDQPENTPGKMQSVLLFSPDAADKKILQIQSEFIKGIKSNNFEAVAKALKKGAVPRGCSVKIPSTLHYVAANGNHKIAKLLLENGVPVNTVNKDGHTPLFVAVQKKNLQICKVFLQFGAWFEFKETDKRKGLKTLVKEDKPLYSLFKTIINIFKLAKEGNNSLIVHLNHCVESENFEVLQVLMNCVNRQGLSLTGTALASHHLQLAKELIVLRVKHI